MLNPREDEEGQWTGIFEAIELDGGVPCATPNDAAAFVALMRAQMDHQMIGEWREDYLKLWCKLADLPDTTFVWWCVLLT